MAKRKETVTRVIDGDTFLTKSRKHPVRLANVWTPDKRGKKAARMLKKLIEGKTVEVKIIGRDTFGRAVAHVRVGGRSVNEAIGKRDRR